MSEDKYEVDHESNKPVFDWDLTGFILGVIALFCFVYSVYLLIQMW